MAGVGRLGVWWVGGGLGWRPALHSHRPQPHHPSPPPTTPTHPLSRGDRGVILVLEELDLFAVGRQHVLYTVLDELQVSSVTAAVLASSTRVDVVELLEKRVRSRFSGRREVLLAPGGAGAAARGW